MTSSYPQDVLRRQYDRAVEEYRFQVDLNWRRSEYFFVLNVGVLIAGATMFSSEAVPKAMVAVLFLVGALLASLSYLANDVQSGYYKAARNLKRDLETEIGLGSMALATTPGMGSSIARLGRVGTFLKIMLVAIGLADVTGAGFSLARTFEGQGSGDGKEAVVSIRLQEVRVAHQPAVLVVSQANELVESRMLRRGQTAVGVSLEPGQYRIAVDGPKLCQQHLRVEEEPLQLVFLRC